jgi:uncharacterized membrane protein
LNKKHFIEELKEELKKFPKEDMDSLIYDFEEHFNIGLKKGRNEAEIIKSLGTPKIIAKHAKAYVLVKKAQNNTSVVNFSKAIIATLSLGFFNIVFILGILIALYGTLYGLLFGFFLAAGAIIFAGIAAIISPLIAYYIETISFGGIHPIVIFFFGIGLTSFGLLFFIANGYISLWFSKIILKLLKMNIKIIEGVIE